MHWARYAARVRNQKENRMFKKLGLLAVLGMVGLASTSAPVQAIFCPRISSRCCYTETDPTTGCPICACYIGDSCC